MMATTVFTVAQSLKLDSGGDPQADVIIGIIWNGIWGKVIEVEGVWKSSIVFNCRRGNSAFTLLFW